MGRTRRRKEKLELPPIAVTIDGLDLQANGVGRHDGKIVFVRGALPTEQVQARIVRQKARFDVAELASIERESSQRIAPRCAFFGVCGGCSMQHLAPAAQLAIKQRVLEDQLKHIGSVRPEQILRPVSGRDWGYRNRARLSVRDVFKKERVLVGFHEKGKGYVADMTSCEVLPRVMSDLLLPLRQLIESLSIRRRLPQIEVAIAESASSPQGDGSVVSERIALVLRVMDPPSDDDTVKIEDFSRQFDVQIWLQSGGPGSVVPLNAADSDLFYRLRQFGLKMPFAPMDFTQVNPQINEALVGRAMALLDPQPGERIADLFCGLGNFSLPIARLSGSVVGIEGSKTLCERAREGAQRNGVAQDVEFFAEDLFKMDVERWSRLGALDKLLIDPPRDGAMAVAETIAQAEHKPARIVYVSCNPATLARDAAVLVHQAGYRLRAAGVVNMFPHTSHVESIACFER